MAEDNNQKAIKWNLNALNYFQTYSGWCKLILIVSFENFYLYYLTNYYYGNQ